MTLMPVQQSRRHADAEPGVQAGHVRVLRAPQTGIGPFERDKLGILPASSAVHRK